MNHYNCFVPANTKYIDIQPVVDYGKKYDHKIYYITILSNIYIPKCYITMYGLHLTEKLEGNLLKFELTSNWIPRDKLINNLNIEFVDYTEYDMSIQIRHFDLIKEKTTNTDKK